MYAIQRWCVNSFLNFYCNLEARVHWLHCILSTLAFGRMQNNAAYTHTYDGRLMLAIWRGVSRKVPHFSLCEKGRKGIAGARWANRGGGKALREVIDHVPKRNEGQPRVEDLRRQITSCFEAWGWEGPPTTHPPPTTPWLLKEWRNSFGFGPKKGRS